MQLLLSYKSKTVPHLEERLLEVDELAVGVPRQLLHNAAVGG